MATHSRTLAWEVPWMEESGGLQSMGSQSRMRLSDFQFSLSCIGEGNGNPLQCSCLENPRDGGAWWAAVYGVTQSWTRLKRLSRLDLLAVQGTLKSFLQHHSSKASILLCSAFFIVQLSHLYMTTGKTIALTRLTFVDKVMSLLFNMMSRFVIDFPAKSECLLISWLQSPPAVIFEPKKIKSLTISTLSSSICLEVMELLLYHIRE